MAETEEQFVRFRAFRQHEKLAGAGVLRPRDLDEVHSKASDHGYSHQRAAVLKRLKKRQAQLKEPDSTRMEKQLIFPIENGVTTVDRETFGIGGGQAAHGRFQLRLTSTPDTDQKVMRRVRRSDWRGWRPIVKGTGQP